MPCRRRNEGAGATMAHVCGVVRRDCPSMAGRFVVSVGAFLRGGIAFPGKCSLAIAGAGAIWQ
ncbi:hypothetical protein CAP48_17365 [Advenella sp. S44]|nr:hypothetical protein CAP48_17365 [Advenella sp. S44]